MAFWQRILLLIVCLAMAGPLYSLAATDIELGADWRTANRESTGIAPDPAHTPQAVIQVYGARAFSWRGLFGIHSWIAVKPANARQFSVYQIIGWQKWFGKPVLSVTEDVPDRRWYGNPPEILLDLRGPSAEAALPKLRAAIEKYDHGTYRMWPGPNSNSFTAHVARAVPELGLVLPPTAIGKDFLMNGAFHGPAPSGTGHQISFHGLFGALYAEKEGIELNFLGLIVGFDPFQPALLLPGIGRIALGE